MNNQPFFSIDKTEHPYYPLSGKESTRSSRKKRPILIIIGIIVVIFVGMTSVLAARIWDPLWNPFRPSPEAVLAKSFKAHSDLKTIHQDLNFSIEFENQGQPGSIAMVIKRDIDRNDINNPKSRTFFELSISSGMGKMFFDGETRSRGEDVYLKLTTIPLPFSMAFAVYGFNLEELRDQWIRFSPKDFGMSFGWQTLSPEKREQIDKEIQNLIFKYPIVKVKEELPDEIIGDIKVYHYLLVLDKENIKVFLSELMKIVEEHKLLSTSPSQKGLFGEKEKAELDQSIDEFFDKTGEIATEIYIGKKDYLVYQIKGEKLIEASETWPEETGTVKINWKISFSKFNQPMNIVAPEESKSVMELFMSILGPYMKKKQELPGEELPAKELPSEFPKIPGLSL
jgi:hypothetical protein